MKKKKALIGMSGGVDSSVAACLTLQQYDCAGGTMRLHNFSCGGADDAADAQAVAEKLGIPHHIFSFQPEFEQAVINSVLTSKAMRLIRDAAIVTVV